MLQKAHLSVSLMCLPHFDFFSDLLLYRLAATWNLFILYDKDARFLYGDSTYMRLSSDKSCVRTIKCVYN